MTLADTTTTRAEEARTASFYLFILLGHLALCSVAWVPEYIDRLGVSFAMWGTILGIAPIGAMAAVLIATQLLLRFGARRVMRLGVAVATVSLIFLGLTTNWMVWAAVNLVFNFFSSLVAVAINTHSVTVQKRINRPIIGGLHGGWSIGAVVAAFTGGLATVIMSLEAYLVGVAALTLAVFWVLSTKLLGPDEDGYLDEKNSEPKRRFLEFPRQLWIISLGFFAAAIPEVAVWDWSAVWARDTLEVDLAWRSAPFAAFMVGMIIGRLTLTRRAEKTEVHSLAFRGSLLAAICLVVSVTTGGTLAAIAPEATLILVSGLWALAGYGIAGLGPTLMASAGRVDQVSSARAVSLLTFVSHAVSIGAKVVMGAMAEGIALSAAFWLPIALLVVGAVIVRQQGPGHRADKGDNHPGGNPLAEAPANP
jgi:MFS family permease